MHDNAQSHAYAMHPYVHARASAMVLRWIIIVLFPSLLSFSSFASFRFYQTETMQSFSRHAGGVKNVMFSPDSKSVISCGADCKIKM